MTPTVIAQISDLHVRANGLLSYGVVDCASMLERAVTAIRALPRPPDLVLVSGDLTDGGLPQEYARLARLLSPLPMPVRLMPGNHDLRAALRDAFPGHAYLHGTGPYIQYTTDVGPLRLVAADTVEEGRPEGRLCADRLAWIDRALAARPDRPTLLALHHPPFETLIGPMDRIGLVEGAAELEALVRRHAQVERIVCGHLHRTIVRRFGGTVASTAPSVAHQITLDIAPDGEESFIMEPPAYLLHAWTPGAGLVSHVACVGRYPGPFPFSD